LDFQKSEVTTRQEESLTELNDCAKSYKVCF